MKFSRGVADHSADLGGKDKQSADGSSSYKVLVLGKAFSQPISGRLTLLRPPTPISGSAFRSEAD